MSVQVDVSRLAAICETITASDMPQWVCEYCDPAWKELRKEASRYDALEEAKVHLVVAQEFRLAAKVRDLQTKKKQLLKSLIDELLNW